ncbi:hypothetical protein JRF84_34590, partial [Methylobacterium organophilum]|nr:hypothetical protein [Methylobacterium organophilum]
VGAAADGEHQQVVGAPHLREPLRGTAADPAQTTASLRAPATGSGASKPWCAQERRVGTGQGFCLVN